MAGFMDYGKFFKSALCKGLSFFSIIAASEDA